VKKLELREKRFAESGGGGGGGGGVVPYPESQKRSVKLSKKFSGGGGNEKIRRQPISFGEKRTRTTGVLPKSPFFFKDQGKGKKKS